MRAFFIKCGTRSSENQGWVSDDLIVSRRSSETSEAGFAKPFVLL
ncbi:hypothetical protein NEIMUCOT_03663 [Neisseria mucosa ATCC 25996]|uniref:Uncharacterized protein n=1 Tax=Neisseria mucosa (strain ATCC 25996 / DSM 4631 / NCTC 10774 / M26) TaxID=546266 RepID=D2ZST1_NEIM2|nr:hypothetical protein NEIMUCOT_03663 [Neisseria mucosa ATCC 25996]